ncbi:MAG TPA: response regulator, partial [Steroidobacteraceae bacterium]
MGVILVAYERESEQTALEQLLGGRGHQVVKASNGLTALDLARREPPHLVVSDIVLPRMDGFALCRKWKQDERLQSIPFIFYTRRHDDPKYERFALELGAERFLARTAQPEALAEAVDQLLNKAAEAAALDRTVIQRRPARQKAEAAASAEGAQQQLMQAHAQALAQLKAEHEQALSQAQQRAEQAVATLKREHEQALATARQALERAQEAHGRLRAQIAELEATQERIAAGEARFRRVFEANPLPMWIADHATRGFIAVNDAALELYGYTRAEFLALNREALDAPAHEMRDEEAANVVAHKSKAGETLFVALASEPIEFDGRKA